jgi:hypothetical protein
MTEGDIYANKRVLPAVFLRRQLTPPAMSEMGISRTIEIRQGNSYQR